MIEEWNNEVEPSLIMANKVHKKLTMKDLELGQQIIELEEAIIAINESCIKEKNVSILRAIKTFNRKYFSLVRDILNEHEPHCALNKFCGNLENPNVCDCRLKEK